MKSSSGKLARIFGFLVLLATVEAQPVVIGKITLSLDLVIPPKAFGKDFLERLFLAQGEARRERLGIWKGTSAEWILRL